MDIQPTRFVQITTGSWRQQGQTAFSHAVYALGEDGVVHRYYRNHGWKPLKQDQDKVAENTQLKDDDS